VFIVHAETLSLRDKLAGMTIVPNMIGILDDIAGEVDLEENDPGGSGSGDGSTCDKGRSGRVAARRRN
jgi:hypothetical protein